MPSIYASHTNSISEFKNNPMAAINDAEGSILAVLSHNKPAFYCLSPDMWEKMIEKMEDMEDTMEALNRLNDKPIDVDIDDL